MSLATYTPVMKSNNDKTQVIFAFNYNTLFELDLIRFLLPADNHRHFCGFDRTHGRPAEMFAKFLTSITLIAQIIPITAHGSIDHVLPDSRPEVVTCDINRTEYWRFINWYFSRSKIMHVVLLSESPDDFKNADTYNDVIQRLVQSN